MTIQIGKTISHYKIVEKLGAGGMGVVYKAEDIKLNRTVALKFLPLELTHDPEAKARFIREAQAASSLQHNNICAIHEINETEDNKIFICMDYYEGETLKDRIKDKGLETKEVIDITIQIAQGLQKAHEKGIIHRDIKPANIFITADGNAKILDFGLAKFANQTQLTKNGMTMGTTAYMSPEQATGKKLDNRTDIWSLGVVLYEMLTGRNPFFAEYDQAILYSIINENPAPIENNEDIPDDLKVIVLRALEKDPDLRYHDIEEFLKDFKPLSTTAVLPAEYSLKNIVRKIGRKYIVISFVTVVLLSILITIWITRSHIFPGSSGKPMEIVVISFENMTGDLEDEYLANFIPSLLRTALGQSKRVRVLTWDYLCDLLKQMDIKDIKKIDREMGYKIAKVTGISTLVTGSYAKVGNSYITDVKVIDPATKDIIIPVSSRGEDISSILNYQIDELSLAILEGINAIDSSYIEGKKPVQEITTTSPEAYRYFVRAGEIGANNFSESIRYLERAVEIDTTFAEAYECLYESYWVLGPQEKSREAAIKAYRHINRAPDNGTRDMIKAAYAGMVEKDIQKYGRFLQAGLRKNPYNKSLWVNYAWYNFEYKKISEAIDCIERANVIDPENKDILISACYIYAWYGDKTKTVEYIDKYMSIDPGAPNTMATAADAYYLLGMFENSLQQNHELGRMYPKWKNEFESLYCHILQENYDQVRKDLDILLKEGGPKASIHCYRSLFFYYMGEINRAFAELDSIPSEVKGRSFQISNAIKGHLLLQQKNIEGARKAFLKLRSDSSYPDIYNLHKAMIYLRQNNLDSCRFYRKMAHLEITELLKSQTSHGSQLTLLNSQMHCDLLQAELLLAADSINQAIDYFNQIKFPTMYKAWIFSLFLSTNIFYNIPLEKDIVPRAHIAKGDIRGAIKAYEKLVRFQPGEMQQFFINPIYYYRLAKLYQQTGQRRKAIDRYKIFLDIWKYADDDLPEKQDAIKRMAELDEN
jgi:serine/threonine protein kinase/tetratricopeptide (TPR) repeat protein